MTRGIPVVVKKVHLDNQDPKESEVSEMCLLIPREREGNLLIKPIVTLINENRLMLNTGQSTEEPTILRPSKWVTMTKRNLSPYFPQVPL
jgi:hypothetical protein